MRQNNIKITNYINGNVDYGIKRIAISHKFFLPISYHKTSDRPKVINTERNE